jgi:hypothetical protein
LFVPQNKRTVRLFDLHAEQYFSFQLFQAKLDFEHLAFVKFNLVFEFVEVRDFDLTGLDVVFDLVQFFLDIVNLVKYFIEVSLFSEVLDFTDPERKLSEGLFTTDFE